MTLTLRGRLSAAFGCALLAAAVLTACGGGGGGGDGGADTPARPAVTLSPISVPSDVTSGISSALTVTVTVNDPSVFNGQTTLYTRIVDDKAVIETSVDLTPATPTTYIATLRTRRDLNPGRYTGTFLVRLCKDSACSAEFPGSPMTLPYDFVVNPGSFAVVVDQPTDVTVHQGARTIPQGNIGVSGMLPLSGPWTATTDSAWLRVSPASGTGPFSAVLTVDPSSLAVGNHSATLTAKTADGRIGLRTIAVQVLPTSFTFSNADGATFTAINGTPIPAQTIQIDLNNGSGAGSYWQAASSESWLKLSPATGNAPAIVTLAPDPGQGRLASGNYTARADFSSPALAASASIPVTLKLVPATFKSSQSAPFLGGIIGHSNNPSTTTLTLNTGLTKWPFTVTGLPSWLSAPSGGQVNSAGTDVTFTFNPETAPFGNTSVPVQITAQVNGDTHTLTLPVFIKNDERHLVPQRAGIGLASTPLGQVLSRTVRVAPSFGDAVPWTASSDAAWLTVSKAGDQLTVTADPAALPSDAISYANVTLSTTTPRVVPATVRIALWKGTTAATAQSIAGAYKRVLADPIRPWIYAHKQADSIDVVNAHTGAVVTTVTIPGTALDAMAVSPDGGRLYVQEPVNKRFAVLRLPDFAVLGHVPQKSLDTVPQFLTVGRPGGVEVLYAGKDAYRITDAEPNGFSLGTVATEPVAVSLDGRHLAGLGTTVPFIEYSIVGNDGMLFAPSTGGLGGGASNGSVQDVAYSLDGTILYSASAVGSIAGYRCAITANRDGGVYAGSLPGGSTYPNNVEVGSDDRVICGVTAGSTVDFWVHNAAGALLQSFKAAGTSRSLLARQLVISADGGVVVTATDDPKLAIVPIGY
ncbi:BACON domain-containing protein [Mitsuaria sp. 7]|uniref:BACON domain-containing protein n=1 Tax=Mitsuaria sp. 7 TaxID=1658665 RepID=UPI0007DD53E7|nr:BACON domain-containing protein [Mitsuaria sp. 7]ANH69760.1 hypothetical protein ABE85_23175 [Mitsuaria sp. 7]